MGDFKSNNGNNIFQPDKRINFSHYRKIYRVLYRGEFAGRVNESCVEKLYSFTLWSGAVGACLLVFLVQLSIFHVQECQRFFFIHMPYIYMHMYFFCSTYYRHTLWEVVGTPQARLELMWRRCVYRTPSFYYHTNCLDISARRPTKRCTEPPIQNTLCTLIRIYTHRWDSTSI